MDVIPETKAAILIVAVLLSIYLLIKISNSAFEFWRNVKPQPGQPPNEVIHTDARHLEHRVTTVEREVKEIRAEMKADRDSILAAGEERAVKLHERINKVLEAVSELKGELKRIVTQ